MDPTPGCISLTGQYGHRSNTVATLLMCFVRGSLRVLKMIKPTNTFALHSNNSAHIIRNDLRSNTHTKTDRQTDRQTDTNAVTCKSFHVTVAQLMTHTGFLSV